MISVLIPVYNGAHILPTTLPAICALEDIAEVVYIDDGSTDGTAGLLGAAEGLRTVTMPENRGRAAARNAGVLAARGDVLVFFDADVEPSAEAAAALARAASSAGAVASVARLEPVSTAPNDPFQDYVCHHPRGPGRATPAGTRIDWRFFLTGACAVRREAFEAAGRFPAGIPYGEDVALACRLAVGHPDGLRLADATVRLHDLGDLPRALASASLFGHAAAGFDEPCPSGALEPLRRAGPVGGLAMMAVPVLRLAVRALGPGPWRRRAVRYLLATTALRAARRA